METFADIARRQQIADRQHRLAGIAKWQAPEPEFGTVHEMRRLRMCEGCQRMASKDNLIELAPAPKRGTAGRYIHGYCYAVRFDLRAFKDLPEAELSRVTVGEWVALGLTKQVLAVCARAAKRNGVVLRETHALARNCTQRVLDYWQVVLGRQCHRPATTLSIDGRPVCAWHTDGRIIREPKGA